MAYSWRSISFYEKELGRRRKIPLTLQLLPAKRNTNSLYTKNVLYKKLLHVIYARFNTVIVKIGAFKFK